MRLRQLLRGCRRVLLLSPRGERKGGRHRGRSCAAPNKATTITTYTRQFLPNSGRQWSVLLPCVRLSCAAAAGEPRLYFSTPLRSAARAENIQSRMNAGQTVRATPFLVLLTMSAHCFVGPPSPSHDPWPGCPDGSSCRHAYSCYAYSWWCCCPFCVLSSVSLQHIGLRQHHPMIRRTRITDAWVNRGAVMGT